MKLKRTAAKATFVGAMSIAAAGFGAGMAQADPRFPSPPPWPIPAPDNGPGANVAPPGNPAPPGLDYAPPPGHGGPMPLDAVAPMWAPPAPPPPFLGAVAAGRLEYGAQRLGRMVERRFPDAVTISTERSPCLRGATVLRSVPVQPRPHRCRAVARQYRFDDRLRVSGVNRSNGFLDGGNSRRCDGQRVHAHPEQQ